MLVPLLLLILFIVTCSMLGGALVISRAARHDLELHVNLIAPSPNMGKLLRTGSDVPILQIAGERLRNLLLTGIQYRWGVRSWPRILLAVSGASMIAGWILFHLLLQFSNWFAVPVALAAGFAMPHMLLRIEQAKAGQRFLDVFPDAVDMIVRMLRAGLPVAAVMRTVGREASSPINSVFKIIADRIEIGTPFEEALITASEQVGLPDFRFFAVAVTLQRSTGGNLASTLEILCNIVRKRREVRLKAHAATAEVRISAYVLGAMPFFVVSALIVVAPNYLAPLITDPRGNVIVAIALLMLLFAFVSMRYMMNRVVRL